MSKYADLAAAEIRTEVEIVSVNRGWYTILTADGVKKVRKADLTNFREESFQEIRDIKDGAAQFTIQGEGSLDSKLVAGQAVADALAENAGFAATDTAIVVEDKNHPTPDRFDNESQTFICGECDLEFMSAAALAQHKDEGHGAPIVAPRAGSLAASLLNRDKTREASITLCQKSSTKTAKEPKPTKINLLRADKCPECGAGTTHGTDDEGTDFNKCDSCDWEIYATKAPGKPKLEPKFENYVVGKGTTASGRQTIDRDDYIANLLRGMDLNDIYAMTARVMDELDVRSIGAGSRKMETGEADFRARYAHLNPGMQRMNLGNVLRGVMGRLGIETLPGV